MFTKNMKDFIIIALVAIFLSPGFGHAKTDDEEMVTSIMELRADIERLYTKIDENKESYKARMKSMALQIADSEAQINRNNTAVKLANIELEKIEEKIANTASENVDLASLLQQAFAGQEKNIKSGIPFKVEERLAALHKISSEFDEKLITQERALALLWASYDDNIRLTKEIGLFKQNISLAGQNVLATVAKLGTVMMFFSTPDGRVGYVSQDGTRYSYKTVDDKEGKNEIALLFDALNKQIRTGYFTLPNALVLRGGKI
ncbi:MAG: DUF3450 family protein [Desulfobulbales bacterium]|nr:DUF3450 family protein [Desulfobulbales bacterium]